MGSRYGTQMLSASLVLLGHRLYQRFAEVHIHSCLTEKYIMGALQWKNCVPIGFLILIKLQA